MKNLVVTPVGKSSLHKKWFSRKSKYDFVALCWEDVPESWVDEALIVIRHDGYKFQNVQQLRTLYPGFIENYDAVFLPDDDIDMTPEDISNLFELCHCFSLDLCQPSLTRDSAYTWPITLWCENPNAVFRLTNFVEIMCPLFSKKGLKICIDSMGVNTLGMGLDYVWPALLDFKNIAVIDAVQVQHKKSLRDWSKVVSLEEEFAKVRAKYSFEWYEHQSSKIAVRR